MTPTSAHPGEIRMIDMFTKVVTVVPIDSVPQGQRFVYLKEGVETSSSDIATQAVPIVEVRMLPIDAAGQLVARDKAVRIRILELGPEGQILRTTLMVPK